MVNNKSKVEAKCALGNVYFLSFHTYPTPSTLTYIHFPLNFDYI